MPPWKPAPGFGDFHGERRLSDRELDLIARWIDNGMPSGGVRELPVAANSVVDWPVRVPDLIVRLPPYPLAADGRDVFRNFVVSIPSTERRRYVRGWHFKAGSTAIHHANVRIDTTVASRHLDEADPLPGYEGPILRSADFPDGHFLGWTPGQSLSALTDDTAWVLEPGADFVIQLHLRPTGKTESIAPVIGLYFGSTAPKVMPVMIRLGRQDLNIPAGAPHHVVQDSFELPVASLVHEVLAHAHYLARSVQGWAELPDGSRRELLRIDDWDPAWQDRYQYRVPFWLPKGTILRLVYTFDNSDANPRNRQVPPLPAGWGWRTSDEMADLWIQVTTGSAGEREELARTARHKMQSEDAIGSETLIGREPDRVDLRNDVATIYMALDKPSDALRHFSAVTQRQPASAPAWFNEGVALEATGNLDSAGTRYAKAIQLDPGYSSAHNNLGSLLMRAGKADDARHAFERAIAGDANNAEARANLALVLMLSGEVDAAIPHVNEALRLRPERAERLIQFVWLLAAAPEANRRRPPAALAISQQISDATGGKNPRAIDALGIADASNGRFADAAVAANTAIALVVNDPALSEAIRGRLSLYQLGKPFVLPR